MIGRKDEIAVIEECLESGRPEFLAVYGRRRVGKTYLIREFFHDDFSFYATGVTGGNTRRQLRVFNEALVRYGDDRKTIPKDWFEAFSRLRDILSKRDIYRDAATGRKVVFLDELPWMDTAKSDFKSAFEYFWNGWGSAQKDLMLIVCGSATSWIINNIVRDTGGFYHRVTAQMHLKPFCLSECEKLLRVNGSAMNRKQMIESYMVFGGIPYYLNYLRPHLSLAQNIDILFFRENSSLRYEFDQLFSSLFRKADHYKEIVITLSAHRNGMTRTELMNGNPKIDGKAMTKCLRELEQCGFIRKYHDFTKAERGCFYQLIDPMTLFCLTFLESRKIDSWIDYIDTPAYYNWCGQAFEHVCLLHTEQIKQRLGIRGISSQEFSWRSKASKPGAQIDLLIDRRDDVINICEMKYSKKEYTITAEYEKELLNKRECFRQETGTNKALHMTMIAANGLVKNQYAGEILHSITGEDLFIL